MKNKFQICVCGWYYYPEFYKALLRVKDKFSIIVIGNKEGEVFNLPFVLRNNIGLDWGAYSFFLDNKWDGKSNVLFMQDDSTVSDGFFEEMSKISFDQAFIFRNQKEFEENYSHGRAFFASGKFLKNLNEDGGILFDEGNNGFIAKGTSWSEKPPKGCQDHNAGIRDFTSKVKRIGENNPELSVNKQVYSEKVRLGRRGVISR
ncbi:MAG: hypothetical protein WC831_02445 [Parcubacteria group bacterium]|jgi:hypothetical protein